MSSPPFSRLAYASAAALLAVWVGIPTLLYKLSGGWEASGWIGDAFNAGTALFSALAVLGVIYTLQRQIADANMRDAEIRSQQRSSERQIFHLGLSTKLQVIQTQIEHDRRAVEELRPSIGTVPHAALRLRELRDDIANEIARDGLSEQLDELRSLTDGLIKLQSELIRIREQIDVETTHRNTKE